MADANPGATSRSSGSLNAEALPFLPKVCILLLDTDFVDAHFSSSGNQEQATRSSDAQQQRQDYEQDYSLQHGVLFCALSNNAWFWLQVGEAYHHIHTHPDIKCLWCPQSPLAHSS
jgi:hypothetical protein